MKDPIYVLDFPMRPHGMNCSDEPGPELAETLDAIAASAGRRTRPSRHHRYRTPEALERYRKQNREHKRRKRELARRLLRQNELGPRSQGGAGDSAARARARSLIRDIAAAQEMGAAGQAGPGAPGPQGRTSPPRVAPRVSSPPGAPPTPSGEGCTPPPSKPVVPPRTAEVSSSAASPARGSPGRGRHQAAGRGEGSLGNTDPSIAPERGVAGACGDTFQGAQLMRPSSCAYGTAARSNAENVRLVVGGIDTIHLSASKRTHLPVEVLDAADKATAMHVEVPFEWADSVGCLWTLLVQPGGGRAANWVLLKGRDFDLKLCRPESRKVSTVEIRAEALWAAGADQLGLAKEIAAAASALLGFPEQGDRFWKVSRADLCVDVHADFRREDWDRWRKLARFDGEHVGLAQDPAAPVEVGAEQSHSDNGTFSGWVFGRGDPLQCRIYLKSLQAPKKSPWIFDLWQRCPNYDARRPVWRVEFECKRAALKAWSVDTLDQLRARQTAIWRYLTWCWLTLRATRQHDKERAVAASWRWISEGAFDPLFLASTPPASRSARDALDLRQTLAQVRGLMTTAAAVLEKTGYLRPTDLEGVREDADLFPAWMRQALDGAIAAGALEARGEDEQQAALHRARAKRLSSASERLKRREAS